MTDHSFRHGLFLLEIRNIYFTRGRDSRKTANCLVIEIDREAYESVQYLISLYVTFNVYSSACLVIDTNNRITQSRLSPVNIRFPLTADMETVVLSMEIVDNREILSFIIIQYCYYLSVF